MIAVENSFTRRYSRLGLLAALLLAVLAALWLISGKKSISIAELARVSDRSDPRLSYAGPYLNIHPDVEAVGNAKCANCHAEIAQKFASHPMGQSILSINDPRIVELVNDATHSFGALGSQFHISHAAASLSYSETRSAANGKRLFEIRTPISHVIGSGNKGHSFLSESDGFVTQAAISWFSQQRIWDVSPGFPPELHLGRPIQVDCLYCHSNSVVPVPGTINRYEQPLFHQGEAISCERCHGPGGKHVQVWEGHGPTSKPDYSIVNPRRLDPALREAVCQQCHLAGETRIVRAGRNLADFRPGLPLDSVLRVIVRDHQGEDRKAVNHVEQMYMSKCFQASSGKLGCITCHDPHEKASFEKRAEHYRAACLNCHDCASPRAERVKLGSTDNCVACHMPVFAASDIVHAATTDHRIVRTRERAKQKEEASRPGTRPLLFFPAARPDFRAAAEGRDYAVGLVEMAQEGKVAGAEIAREALPLLEQAIGVGAGDVRAWEAKSYALQFSGRKTEAFAAAQTVLSLRPEDEAGLVHAALLAAEVNRADHAIEYWRRAIRIDPYQAAYRQELANVLAKAGDWPSAGVEADEAIRLDPARTTARTLAAIAHDRAGDRSRADELFREVELLAPANLAQLRQRYNTERAAP
jgi:Flp pilus assembly protein TadD